LIGVVGSAVAIAATWAGSQIEAQRTVADEQRTRDLQAKRAETDQKARTALLELESAVKVAEWDRAAPIAERVRELVAETEDASLRSRANQLYDRVSRERAIKLEPELQKLMEEARAAVDKKDYVRAQSLLTDLSRYQYCESYRRAQALATEVSDKKSTADVGAIADFITGDRGKGQNDTPVETAKTDKPNVEKPKAVKGQITRENYDKIKDGWTRQQVIDLLGQPELSSDAMIGDTKTEVLHYQHNKAFGLKGFSVIQIQLTDDKVVLRSWLDQ
jgi:hypothetical protein